MADRFVEINYSPKDGLTPNPPKEGVGLAS